LALTYRVLGPFEVLRDGAPVDLGPPKQRALLAILLLRAGELVPSDRLVDLLWSGRPPRTAAHSVQVYISALRRSLGGEQIETRTPGYLLHLDGARLDSAELERLVAAGSAAARAGDHDQAVACYEEGLALWRGDPLADFTYLPFAGPELGRLGERRVEALAGLGSALLYVGRPEDAVRVLRAAVADDPLRERLRFLLVLALYRSGRQADALRSYQDFRHLLDEELGLVPSAELQRLQEQVLLQDPALQPTAGPGRSPNGGTRNPYKGLRPFLEEDADDFFGRTRMAADLAVAVASTTPLIALVGPSGSGKSSLIRAGLLPLLHGAGDGSAWTVVVMTPGRGPVDRLRMAIRETETSPPQPSRGDGHHTRRLLVVDQFEEAFTLAAADDRRSFLDELVSLASTNRLGVLVSLRADLYDRPFEHPAFAALFTSAVVNMTPLTPAELEEAVEGPASRVGVAVQPGLLAEIVSEMAAAPGALPRCQYTLAELFDGREDDALTLEGYHRLGGLTRALTDGAERLYQSLDLERRAVARLVLLRLVAAGATPGISRRVPVRELLDLDVDPVALHEVLEVLAGHRLITFDGDPATGTGTVEVAHEALLREWPRASAWVEEHRADVARRDSLARAREEWEASGRHPDFLLSGERLTGFEEWSTTATSGLTRPERAYLQASSERRRATEREESARLDRERRVNRRARRRLWGLAVATVLLAVSVVVAVAALRPEPPPAVALAGEGRGGGDYSDMVFDGFERAAADLGLSYRAAEWATPEDVRRWSEEGVGLIVLPSVLPVDHDRLAAEFPGTHYVVLEYPDSGSRPNLSSVVFDVQEGAFLAGVAAALASDTGRVGFVGGVDTAAIHAFQAGFEAGAWSVDPATEVDVVYLTPDGDWSGFGSATLGLNAARHLYGRGADVVFHAAGASGAGVLRAAPEHTARTGRHVWAIGVDVDQYRLHPTEQTIEEVEQIRPHVLTSMVKRVDLAIAGVLEEFRRGALAGGPRYFDVGSGTMELTETGGFLEPYLAQLDDATAALRAGELEVPVDPVGERPLVTDVLGAEPAAAPDGV
jgi:basic membrane lipoprotein Med (substrate-binding protein (PBP1-ABC) superfamily)/DNA-binding SARP family transcriptional activator